MWGALFLVAGLAYLGYNALLVWLKFFYQTSKPRSKLHVVAYLLFGVPIAIFQKVRGELTFWTQKDDL